MKKTALAFFASGALAACSFAAEIPLGLTWLPSDPLNISLNGNQAYDLWLNLASSPNGLRTYTNPSFPTFPFSYIIPGTTGYGTFPGNGNWPAPIKSQIWTDGHTQGELHKISNGAGGGPFPSGSTIYYGGASPVANTDGGTLGAKSFAIDSVQTVTFQLSLGEAYGYTLWDADGNGFGVEDMPKLTVYDTFGGVLATLNADYSDIIKKAYNGSLDMPPGSGVDEDIYINTFGLQWDLSALAGQVGSFQVNWTGVQHAQLWSFRMDQTDVAYSDFIFDLTSNWTGGGNGIWNAPSNWEGGSVASAVGKAVFAVGSGVQLSEDTTVGQITIRSNDDFTISSQNGSKLTSGLNIITEARSGPADHTVSTDVILPTTVTLDVGEDTTLTMSGSMTGVGFYKRGPGRLTISGNNDYTGNLVFAGGTTVVSGLNTTSGTSLLDIKNARVILQGNDRFSAAFGAKLAGTSTHGQRAYLQLGDENTGPVTQTLASLDAAKPQYVKDLNPNPQADPPAYVVGGHSEISTLTVKGGIYSGYLGGEGLHENNLSLVVDGNFTLQGTSTYEGETLIKSGAVLQVNRSAALSAHSNLVLNGGILALGSFSYMTPGGDNAVGILLTESFETFTRALGTGAGEVQFNGDGGFRAAGGNRTINLGGANATVTWGEGHFVGNGNKLILASDSTSTITFANGIALGNVSRTVEVSANGTAELSGVLSGQGGLTKTGSGNLSLAALNTYTGVTRIENGQLRISEIGNAGTPSILGHTSSAASNLVLVGGQLVYVGSGSSSTDRLFTIAGTSAIVANDGTGLLHFSNTGAIAYNYAGALELQLRGTSNEANRFDPRITNNGAHVVSVRKSGAGSADTGGRWIIGNETNSYTGSTFINSGLLEVTKLANGGQNSSIGASSNAATSLKFFRGGMTYTGGGDSTDRLFSISAYGATYSANRIDASGTGALKFTNTGALGLTSSASGATAAIGTGGHLALGGTNTGDNTLAATIGGSNVTNSRLTKDGPGRWILTNANSSYKGLTEILGGTLGVHKLANGNANSSIGSSTNAADRLLINGGVLQYLGSGDSTDRRFTVGANGATLDASGSGVLVFNNVAAVTYATTNVARSLTLTGTNTGANILAAAIGNAGTGATSVVKAGSGRWILSGGNTYTGSTSIQAGTLTLGSSHRLADTTAVTVASNATFDLAGYAETIGSLAGSGRITLGSGALTVGANHTDTLFSGSISGSGNLTKTGTGRLTLNTANGFEGGTTLSGGTVTLGHTNALGTTGAITFQGGTLQYGTGNTTDYSGRFAAAALGQFFKIDTNGQDVAFHHVLSGEGGLEKLGLGSLTLNAVNTFSGNTVLSGGFLILGNSAALQNSSVVLNGGQIDYGSFTQVDIGNLSGSGAQALNEGTTFNVGTAASGTSTYSGALNGGGTLQKTGDSTLVLSGDSQAFNGQATVTAGTLVVAGGQALGSASVNVSGGTFQVNAGVTLDNAITLEGGTYVKGIASSYTEAGEVSSGFAHATSVQFLGGSSSGAEIAIRFSDQSPVAGDSAFRVSDVFTLTGTGSDVFVLELSVSGQAEGQFLAWYNGSEWVNAVLGNTGGTYEGIYGGAVSLESGLRGYAGSFASSGAAGSLNFLGAWGFDQANGKVWAVLNHNSAYAVIAVPEPSAWLLAGLGATLLLAFRRRAGRN